jgi:hypothetical protein
MIIKGPIKVKVGKLTLTIKNIDVSPSDPSVGIMGEYIEGYDIVDMKHKTLNVGPNTHNRKVWLERFYNSGPVDDDKYMFKLEDAIFKELYKLEQASYEAAWKRAKKRGFNGTKSEFMSEYT